MKLIIQAILECFLGAVYIEPGRYQKSPLLTLGMTHEALTIDL